MRFALPFLLALAINCSAAQLEQPDKAQMALVTLAQRAEDEGRLADAIDIHKQIIASHPNEIRSINTIAGLYGNLGDFDQEISWAQRALDIDNRFEPALINLASGYGGKEIPSGP